MQMRVERSQDNDFIADNEELRGEDFDEDADVSDDDADLSDDDADLTTLRHKHPNRKKA